MAISLTLNFDDTWAGRIYPAVDKQVHDAQRHPVVLALLDAYGATSVDDLTPKQKAKLSILFHLMTLTMRYEGDVAEVVARQSVVEDIEANFPLEID